MAQKVNAPGYYFNMSDQKALMLRVYGNN